MRTQSTPSELLTCLCVNGTQLDVRCNTTPNWGPQLIQTCLTSFQSVKVSIWQSQQRILWGCTYTSTIYCHTGHILIWKKQSFTKSFTLLHIQNMSAQRSGPTSISSFRWTQHGRTFILRSFFSLPLRSWQAPGVKAGNLMVEFKIMQTICMHKKIYINININRHQKNPKHIQISYIYDV